MPCWELENDAWRAEHEAEPAHPFGPPDDDADMAEERRPYHRFGFELLGSDEDLPL